MVTGASEGQEGCPQAGPLGQGCRLKKPTAPSCQLPHLGSSPSLEGRKPLSSLLRTHQVGPWCPHSAPCHAHMLTRSHGTHTPSLPPSPQPLCALPSLSPHVPLSPCHQCRVLHGHTFTCAHKCIGAVSTTSLSLMLTLPVCAPTPQVCETTRPSPSLT